jgi:NADPH:quinone reductase-like Zn-dependent oxidoreductase
MLIYGNLTWKGFGIDRWLSTCAPDAVPAILTSLWALIRRDALPLPVDSAFSLAAFREALAADAKPGRRGKVLLT